MEEDLYLQDENKQGAQPERQQLGDEEPQEQGDEEPQQITEAPEKIQAKQSLKLKNIYKPNQFPPDLKLVEKHRMANKVGITENLDDFCACCSKAVNKKDVALCLPRLQMGFLGPLFPLYFKYILYCILVCLIMFLINITPTIMNYVDNSCSTCSHSQVVKLSLINSADPHRQTIFNLVTVIVLLLCNQIYFKSMRVSEARTDEMINSPSDYTLMITKLPPGQYTESDITHIINQFFSIHKKQMKLLDGATINNINMAYKMSDFYDKLTKIESMHQEKLKNFKEENDDKNGDEKAEAAKLRQQDLDIEIQIVEKQMKLLEQQVQKGESDQTAGVVFVCFDKQDVNNFIIEKTKIGILLKAFIIIGSYFLSHEQMVKMFPSQFIFKGQLLNIERAPEPNDIQWQNMGVSNTTLFKLNQFTNLATTIILALCFCLILAIYQIQESLISHKDMKNIKKSHDISDKIKVYVLSFFGSFFIVFVNTILLTFIRIFSNKQKLPTSTDVSTAIAQRLSISQFINTALIILIVEKYVRHQQLQYGLVQNIFTLFMSNAVVSPFLNYFNIFYLIRIIKRKQILNPEKNQLITQKVAHNWFNGAPLMMEFKYSLVLKSLCLTAFYLPLSAVFVPITIFGLFCTYWVDKYLLLRRYQEPPLLSPQINRTLSSYLDFIPLCVACGGYVFKSLINQQAQNNNISFEIDILTICISCLNFIIPSLKINQCLFKVEMNVFNNETYDQARLHFNCEYDRTNPLTKKKAMQKWFDFQKEQGIIEAEEAEKLKEQQENNHDMVNNMFHKAVQQNQQNEFVNYQQNQQRGMMNLLNQQRQFSQYNYNGYQQPQQIYMNQNGLNNIPNRQIIQNQQSCNLYLIIIITIRWY